MRCVRMAMERTAKDPEAREYLDLAHAGMLRMADIVKSLLTFSRHAAIEQKPEPLGRLAEEAVTGVQLALGDDAPRIASEIEASIRELPVPRGLHQVLTNLVRNAADATGRTGRIRVVGARDGETLRVRVEDDGPGMPPAILQRIFEPFFTTKPPGKGTGPRASHLRPHRREVRRRHHGRVSAARRHDRVGVAAPRRRRRGLIGDRRARTHSHRRRRPARARARCACCSRSTATTWTSRPTPRTA